MSDNTSELDKLTGQLYYLPGIIGNLGVSVANAQKVMNDDYIRNIQLIMQMAHGLFDKSDSTADKMSVIKDLLKELAPTRYQFTETSLEFSADLSERKTKDSQGALGGGMGGFTITAGYASSFGYDYRAAARVKTVLHPMPPVNEEMSNVLLDSAKEKGIKLTELPAPTKLDKATYEGLANIAKILDGTPKEVEKVLGEETDTDPNADPAEDPNG